MGFKLKIYSKSITKIYKEINDKMKSITLGMFMSATHLFGRGIGDRRLKDILKVFNVTDSCQFIRTYQKYLLPNCEVLSQPSQVCFQQRLYFLHWGKYVGYLLPPVHLLHESEDI